MRAMIDNNFRSFIYDLHDNKCNQKYADNFPYSTHLKFVESQGNKFLHLLENEMVWQENGLAVSHKDVVTYAMIAHDSIEDARMTYNNLISELIKYVPSVNAVKAVADIVYCVTDEKGKSRKERKNDKYYQALKGNDLALFVKLADIAANTLFSKLSGSSMYDKYRKEWPMFKAGLYKYKYDEFFEYIDKL